MLCYSRLLFFPINPRFQRFDCKVFLTDAQRYMGGVVDCSPSSACPAFHSRPSVVRCPGTATQEGLSLVVERSELEAASLAGGEAGCALNPNTVIQTVSRLEVRVVGPLPIPAVCPHPLPEVGMSLDVGPKIDFGLLSTR